MNSDTIADGEALPYPGAVNPGSSAPAPLPDDSEFEASFEEFRVALRHARSLGSITAMRAAVAAYDRFARAVGAA